MILPRSKAWR